MGTWYARPIIFISNMQASLDFYVDKLGFEEAWRYEEEGEPRVVQVDRNGTELILSNQWPAENIGRAATFVALDLDVLEALRVELAAKGIEAKEGRWGYRVAIVTDPDGNQLYFPYPAD
jgi:catechol 2,3-dioxygenase-like lactoylglutathione lyase family enzyme